MTQDADTIVTRLHGVLEAIGLVILTPLMGSKRANQERLQTLRVTAGGMIGGAASCAALIGIGSAAMGVSGPGVLGLSTGMAFFGAFLGIFAGLVLRVVVGSKFSSPSPRENEGRKQTGS